MTRFTAAVLASAALFLWMDVGSAQQPSMIRIAATTGNDLRTWDGWVTARLRTGELRALRVEQDPSLPSRRIERMQQYYEGVPIFGAEIVRDSDAGVPQSIFGEIPQPFTLDTQPSLSPAQAELRIMDIAGAGARLLRKMEMMILPLAGSSPRLAYTAVVSNSGDVFRIFIDANTGAELSRFSRIQTQSAVGTGRGLIGDTKKMSVLSSGGTFFADDRLRPPSLVTYDMRNNLIRTLQVLDGFVPLFQSDLATDFDNEWSDIPAVDGHAYIGWTYDYYFKRHGRRGLDNRDRPITTLINGVSQQQAVSLPPEFLFTFAVNAFWCGDCGPGFPGVMFFGNGIPPNFTLGGQTWTYLAGSLDVAAHELTHAVTESSSNLIYQNESGALNESFSDIMGTSVEFFYQQPGPGIGQADFLIGEDSIRSPFGGLHGIRSMANPFAFTDPDHYSIRFRGQEDNGGVHINSGIPNHAYYLALNGGTNRVSGLSVAGIGIANREQLEKVFYRAFVFLLPANATFATARMATIQAARDLYPASPNVATAVTQAWTAVGVN
jgi:thermolysin